VVVVGTQGAVVELVVVAAGAARAAGVDPDRADPEPHAVTATALTPTAIQIAARITVWINA
jgi:hypothetical protein